MLYYTVRDPRVQGPPHSVRKDISGVTAWIPSPPPRGRTTAPPPVDLSSNPGASGLASGAASIYEPRHLNDPADGDVQVVIVDANLRPIETLASAAEIAPHRRAVQMYIPSRPAPIPSGPAAVEATGPWTVGEPAPPAPVIRKVVQNAPPAPAPRRKATVKFTSFGPADREEQGWVIGGETGLRIVTADEETGRPRLAAVYLAFMVESYVVDDARPDEVTVFGKVRWHGMPEDRNEEWMNKLLRWHGGERLKEFKAALEMDFGYVDPRIYMVNRFLGGPATTAESAALHGYQSFPGNGDPATKYMRDMSRTQAGALAAIAFYRQAQDYSALPLRRQWWKWFSSARYELYNLGERFTVKGLPPVQAQDGLTPFQRACLTKDVAAAASSAVASLGKVAWRGDHMIEQALLERQLAPVAATTYTVYQGE